MFEAVFPVKKIIIKIIIIIINWSNGITSMLSIKLTVNTTVLAV